MHIFNRNAAGVIPSFPVWEITLLCFIITAAFITLFRPDFWAALVILGEAADKWSLIFIAIGFICLVGLFISAPTGLLVILVGKVMLFSGATGMFFSLSSLYRSWFFPGCSIIFLLMTGSLFRIIQILYLFKISGEEVKHSASR